MKNFYCGTCGSRVYFSNTVCLSCGGSIAFELERQAMIPVSGPRADLNFKLCQNYAQFNTCNWAVPANCDDAFCSSCRLTETIPDLSLPQNRKAWGKIEEAKRRLVYNLNFLQLRPQPMTSENPDGLLFRFLADRRSAGEKPVLTGHLNGVVTLDIAEADDAERERRRTTLGEPYRTLVGHLRHEVGHYYWDQLVSGYALHSFRKLFGDETQDYGEALKRHYRDGPPPNWSTNHISAYAAAHPWEDWAETWAHYLHMIDSLGTAYHSCVSIDSPNVVDPKFNYRDLDLNSFDSIISHWPAVACMINSFNRSLGMPDAYPFVIAPAVVEKLRFVHDVIGAYQSKT